MRRIAAILLLTVLVAPAIPVTAQGIPDLDDPYSGGIHEGTRIVWMCVPNPSGVGQTCNWVYDTGPGHSHGPEDDHDDHDEDENHRPDPLARLSASCQSVATDIRCEVSLSPAEGSEQPVRYRILFIDAATKDQLHIEKVSPTNLNPTVEFAGDSNSIRIKAQAVGECKRERKRDAEAKNCSRFKSSMAKTTIQVAD